MKNNWPLMFFCLAHVLIMGVLFNSDLVDHRYTASTLYFHYADRTFEGLIPYRDFPLEYPPVALVFFLLPRFFTSSVSTYGILFVAEIILFDLIGLYLVSAAARFLKLSVLGSLGMCTLALLAVGPMINLRYDLIPAIMMLAALYAFYRDKNKTAWTMLALGTMTKLYPAVIAPIFLIYQIMHRQYRRVIVGSITFSVVCLLAAHPFLILARDGFISSFGYHADRGLQLESTYASILAFAHILKLLPLSLDFDFGSWNVVGPLADNLSLLSTPIVFLCLILLYFLYVWRQWRHFISPTGPTPDYASITNCSTVAVIIFMAAGKVLSPQFIIWLYPLMPLVAGTRRYAAWVLFVALGLMTYYIFPVHYLELMLFGPAEVNVLLWRNVFLLALGILLIATPVPQEARVDWYTKPVSAVTDQEERRS